MAIPPKLDGNLDVGDGKQAIGGPSRGVNNANRQEGCVRRSVLFIVENNSVPFDQRVWQEARTLRHAGYRVTVLCPRDPGQQKREVLEQIEIFRHPALPEGSGAFGYLFEYSAALFWELLFTWRVFLRSGFDAIHLSNPPDTLFIVGGLFKLLFATKVIFDHHDICPELYESKFGRRGLLYRVIGQLEKWSMRTADIVISTNDCYRRIAIERGGKDPSRVFVVRNGPNLERLQVMAPVPSLKRGRQYLVGYVGVIGAQEGLKYLLDAAAYLIHDCHRTDIHFGIVGSGSELADIRRLAIDLGIDDYFTFTGRVPDDTLLEYLNTADVCVNPDEHNPMNDSSTMIKIMEYMALGKPIVQFDLREGRVSAEEASLYARPNDAVDFGKKIVALLDDPAKRASMGGYGRKRVEHRLAWKHQAPRLLAAYNRLWSKEAS
jgi:glycosyltransferase involved in cell wall biosynthesis